MTPSMYLDALRARHSLTTDFAVAKLLKVERATVSNWRAGRRAPDDSQALAIAKLLAIPRYRVLLDAAASRAQTPAARAAWRELARQVLGELTEAAILATPKKG